MSLYLGHETQMLQIITLVFVTLFRGYLTSFETSPSVSRRCILLKS